MNKIIIAAIMSMFFTNMAFAVVIDNSCEAKATEKKLFGAAKTSFIKKCNKDAGATNCGTQASDKKLAGAAKNSFIKKCEKDAAAVK
jgi:hypothetical protein